MRDNRHCANQQKLINVVFVMNAIKNGHGTKARANLAIHTKNKNHEPFFIDVEVNYFYLLCNELRAVPELPTSSAVSCFLSSALRERLCHRISRENIDKYLGES